jgi:hypothetical protein
MTTKK